MAKLYVVEARDHNGSLITEPGKQPPFAQASAAQLHDYYHEHSGSAVDVSFEKMQLWYEAKGWFIRSRTW